MRRYECDRSRLKYWFYFIRMRLSTIVVRLIVRARLAQVRKALRSAPNQQIFHCTWDYLIASRLIKRLYPYCENVYQLSRPGLLFFHLVSYMLKRGLDYAAQFDAASLERASSLIDDHRSFIAVQMHTGCSFVVRAMQLLNRRVSAIAAYPEDAADNVLRRAGVTSGINFILRDRHCLTRTLNAARRGEVICCNVDFAHGMQPFGKRKNKVYRFVSPVMFEFACKSGIPIFFLYPDVSETSRVVIAIEGPYTNVQGDDCANRFIDFIKASSSHDRDLTVRNYVSS